MTSINTLEISIRSRQALHSLGIDTVEELAVTPDPVLLRIPNCGRKTLKDVRASYDVEGLSIEEVQNAVGSVYNRFYGRIRDIVDREHKRLQNLETRFARVVLRIEEQKAALQQTVDELELRLRAATRVDTR